MTAGAGTLKASLRRVTVSIVSHGQGELVHTLLHQLDAFSQASIAKVIVTQNLPEVLSHDALSLGFPLEIIANPVPLGFGCNHNQAFAHCGTDWFLVLNPDIELSSDAIGALLAGAGRSAGIVAPSVQEPDCAGPTPERHCITPWEVLVGQRLRPAPPASPVWFPGMFMLFRAVAFKQAQGFDERFHMYCEDFDVCARLRLRGWLLERNRNVVVQHQAQRDSHARLRYLVWHLQSLMRLWTSAVFWRYWWQCRERPRPEGGLR